MTEAPRTVDVTPFAAEVDWDGQLPARATALSWRIQEGIKRLMDIAGAALLLIFLAPLFVLIAALVLWDGGPPVLYVWRVVGIRGRPFTGYKFRTMIQGADRMKAALLDRNEMQGPVFKLTDDPRMTRVGRVLRRFSVDELPQLWSVLVGDMSLVGPRPMFPHEFAKATVPQRAKLAVRPGMTCLWQVSGRAEITDFEEWVRLDLSYIRDWSLWLDAKILVRTAFVVVTGRGAR